MEPFRSGRQIIYFKGSERMNEVEDDSIDVFVVTSEVASNFEC